MPKRRKQSRKQLGTANFQPAVAPNVMPRAGIAKDAGARGRALSRGRTTGAGNVARGHAFSIGQDLHFLKSNIGLDDVQAGQVLDWMYQT